jgi:hypothetical protein
VTGRYRALLIGISTYPADEHNLQALKGPVKDIAALNRALVDRDSGLFADVDVALLPEATSGRAIRALGRFFGTAARDDVLLVYFSGHGKLDQAGRLHLCMQDTESGDLLSTAVSSARINEFADASRARNVVIVLDCCHSGAFRGAGLGDAVAGPGRYVLTSCRGTQLANDATVENGTSFFTQHLVDGLLHAAADQDEDGYVSFSDLYAYVDRQLREAGKQIPQRRVDGDGDLRLAKRPLPAAAEATAIAERPPVLEVSPSRLDLEEIPAGHTAEVRVSNRGGGDLEWTYQAAEDFYRIERTQHGLLLQIGNLTGRHAGRLVIRSNGGHAEIDVTVTISPGPGPGRSAAASLPGSAAAGNGTTTNGPAPAPNGPRPSRARRQILLAAAAAAVLIAGGVITALVLLPGGSGGNPPARATDFYTHRNFVRTTVLWRLRIEDFNYGPGCSITVTNDNTGSQILHKDSLFGLSYFQMYQKGSFRWQVPNTAGCPASAEPGPGPEPGAYPLHTLPFTWSQLGSLGDTPAFRAPPHRVAVHVIQYHGTSTCDFSLKDVNDGQSLETETATQGKHDTVKLDPGQSKTVYLETVGCEFRVSAAR